MAEQTECKPKIYLWGNAHAPWPRGGVVCYSMAESGHVLGSHFCSNGSWMRHDLHDREDRKATCESFYPDGYELVILPEGEAPPQEVMDRNEALPADYEVNAARVTS